MKMKRWLPLMLSLMLVVGTIPVPARAEEETAAETSEATGLCTHHQAHTEACGYKEGTEGTPCSHVHTEDCYILVANCVHTHTAACYPQGSLSSGSVPDGTETAAPTACTHVCSVESGCMTRVLNCSHVHSGACGYREGTEGTPCGYVCALCPVQELIDALPSAEELKAMTEEEQDAAYIQIQEAHEAYDALTEEEKGQISGGEIFEELFSLLNSMVSVMAEEGNLIVEGGEEGTDYSYADGVLTILTGTPLRISNKEGITNAGTAIVISSGVQANLTLDGVTIAFSDGSAEQYFDSTEAGTCALSVSTDASLNLTLRGENTLQSGAGRAGIGVANTAALTIGGDGTLTVTGGSYSAGIGGGYWNNAGIITITGGIINAEGGLGGGAGIGGGHANMSSLEYGGFEGIFITGGIVTARSSGEKAGAGIGFGNSSKEKKNKKIVIQNAVVTASTEGDENPCAAIGTSNTARQCTADISITGSQVTAKNVKGEAIYSNGIDALIEDSIVTTSAENGNSGKSTVLYGTYSLSENFTIEDGQNFSIPAGSTLCIGDQITLFNYGTVLNDGTITGSGTIENHHFIYSATGQIDESVVLSGNAVITSNEIETFYIDENGDSQTVSARILLQDTTQWGSSDSTGPQWYVALGDVEISDRVCVAGDVRLILSDRCSLTVNIGIGMAGKDTDFTVYAQSTGERMGRLSNIPISLSVTTDNNLLHHPGIGNIPGNTCGDITINGGAITVTGGAGIGCGFGNGACGDITINGGSIVACARQDISYYNFGGSGIGCSSEASECGNIIINGGTVVAYGGDNNVGIGGRGRCGFLKLPEDNESYTLIVFGGYNAGPISCSHNIQNGSNVILVDNSQKSNHNSGTATYYRENVILTDSITLISGVKTGPKFMTINEGNTLTVPENVTLTNDTVIYRDGSLVVNGSLAGSGRIEPGAEASVDDISVTKTICDGEPVKDEEVTYTYHGASIPPAITITWYSDDNGEMGEEIPAPSETGTYWVKVSAAATNMYQSASGQARFRLKEKYSGPVKAPVFISATASSITVQSEPGWRYLCTRENTAPATTAEGWQTADGDTLTFTNLSAGTTWYIWTYRPEDNTYADSEVSPGREVSTNPAAYTVAIPSGTLTAGDASSAVEIAINRDETFDLGYGGTVSVTAPKAATLTNNNNAGITLQSALLVDGQAHTESRPVASFRSAEDAGVSVSFDRPTISDGGPIPAGSYTGTMVFTISYSETQTD